MGAAAGRWRADEALAAGMTSSAQVKTATAKGDPREGRSREGEVESGHEMGFRDGTRMPGSNSVSETRALGIICAARGELRSVSVTQKEAVIVT